MNWYLAVLKNYATFRGRARRKEYWMFELINACIFLVLYILVVATGKTAGMVFSILYYLYVLGTIIPMLAVMVRRLHDINKSGWWFFISFIPLVGAIWLLILTCMDGTHGTNSYGPDPKEAGGQPAAQQ